MSIAELEGNGAAEADGLRKTKVTVASVSNSGECESDFPLRPRQVDIISLDQAHQHVPSSQAPTDCASEDIADAEGLRKIKVANAHASNPGGTLIPFP